jgi:hypothetical protein
MASERQTAANRENAQKSTGPKTPQGRAAVRLNGVKHGLSAETLVLPGENAADLDALFDSLEAQHQPATPTEEILVRQLAMASWRQLRLYRVEVAHFKNEDEDLNKKRGKEYAALDGDRRLALIADRDAINEKQLLNFHRFEVRLERSIRSAIQQLRQCRAERLAADANQTENDSDPGQAAIGFGLKTSQGPQIVPPQPVSKPPEPPTEAPPEADPVVPAA